MAFVDRRREPRELQDRPVNLTSLPNMEISLPGQLTDASYSGLGITTTEPVLPGRWISAEWGDTLVLGRVVYCIETDSRCDLGIRTDYVISDRTGS